MGVAGVPTIRGRGYAAPLVLALGCSAGIGIVDPNVPGAPVPSAGGTDAAPGRDAAVASPGAGGARGAMAPSAAGGAGGSTASPDTGQLDARATSDGAGGSGAGTGGDGGNAIDLSGGIASASIEGYQLLVRPRGGAGAAVPFDVRGISWSPAARGAGRPDGSAHLAAADRDLPLMRAANINVVKTYVAPPRAVLDKLLAHGIYAIVTVLNTAGENFEPAVRELRDHPALLMWLVGNEWNLNQLYGSCSGDACLARVNQAARQLKALDPNHPVATSVAPAGELPTEADLRRLDAVDVFGLNVYSQPGFFNRFTDWRLLAQRTGIKKPILLTEYGADAYDNRSGRADEAAQAMALRRQTQEIRSQLSARNPALPCLGGTPFEWNDEWWKHGNPGAQDPGGFNHAGVAADGVANEEWWGIVDVDRRPRPAYEVLKELYAR